MEEKEEKELLRFVRLKDLGRWDVEYLLDQNKIISKYNLAPVGNILNKFLTDENNNSLRHDTQKYPDKEFKYIGMENIKKENGELLNFQNILGSNIKSQTIKFPPNFFLYGKLRPYLNKYFLNTFHDDNIIVSSEFFVFSIKNINSLYFKFCIGSSFIQYQIKNCMKGARMPRISETIFKNLKIPLPPLNIQTHIANHIQSLKDKNQNSKTTSHRK